MWKAPIKQRFVHRSTVSAVQGSWYQGVALSMYQMRPCRHYYYYYHYDCCDNHLHHLYTLTALSRSECEIRLLLLRVTISEGGRLNSGSGLTTAGPNEATLDLSLIHI